MSPIIQSFELKLYLFLVHTKPYVRWNVIKNSITQVRGGGTSVETTCGVRNSSSFVAPDHYTPYIAWAKARDEKRLCYHRWSTIKCSFCYCHMLLHLRIGVKYIKGKREQIAMFHALVESSLPIDKIQPNLVCVTVHLSCQVQTQFWWILGSWNLVTNWFSLDASSRDFQGFLIFTKLNPVAKNNCCLLRTVRLLQKGQSKR